jgi:hypothetical protein
MIITNGEIDSYDGEKGGRGTGIVRGGMEGTNEAREAREIIHVTARVNKQRQRKPKQDKAQSNLL